MLALVLAALRARRAQGLTLLVLSALAAASAAAAPWYVLASTERISVRQVQTAPVAERTIETSGDGPIEGGSVDAQLESTVTLVRQIVGLDGFTTFTGAYISGFTSTVADPTGQKRQTTSPLSYRKDACAHAIIEGACATAPDEAMISYRTARALRLRPGDRLQYESSEFDRAMPFRVSGIYRPDEPDGPYWNSTETLLARQLPAVVPPDISEPVDDSVLISAAALDRVAPKSVHLIVDLVAQPELFVEASSDEVRTRLDDATAEAANQRLTMTTELYATVTRVERDQRLVSLGVPVGASQLLLLCWFALYLAVKYTGEERRPDIGLLKLRGARRGRTWSLVSGQSAVPMLLGAVLGLPLGIGVAELVNGSISAPDVATRAVLLAFGAVAVAVLGALLAALLAERRALGSTVAELLRQSPSRAQGWRDLFDLVLVLLALVAVYQVKVRASGDVAGLALLAPGLAALACALVLARAVTAIAARTVPGALRAGRPGIALTAIYLARRPGVHRLAALMMVTVAMLGTSYLTWSAGLASAHARAELEVGADRVLTVRAGNRSALLSAVRAADPQGHHAMAAVQSTAPGHDRVLLVDSPRLVDVARWRPEYGMPVAQAAAALHPPAPDPVKVDGQGLVVDLDLHDSAPKDRRIFLDAILAGPTGDRLTVRLGPLVEGRQQARGPAPDCGRAPGCRLSSLALIQDDPSGKAFFTARTGALLTVHTFGQTGPDRVILSQAALADRSRWRLTSSAAPPNLVVTSAADGLALQVATERAGLPRDPGVYPLDSPAPLAAILAKPTDPKLVGDDRVTYGSASLPERVVALAGRLPRLGDQGALADLEYADRLGADFGSGDSQQVWMTADAPKDLRARLEAGGLIVLGDETLDGVAGRYASLGPPLTLHFMLLSAIVGLALAIGSASVVAAVERRPRAAELAALRAQGAPARLVSRVGIGSYVVLVTVSVLAGLILSVLLRIIIGDVLPFFADGWKAP